MSFRSLLILALALTVGTRAWGQFERLEELFEQGLTVDGPLDGLEISKELGTVVAPNGAKLSYKGIRLSANRVEINLETHDIMLQDDVRVYRDQMVFQGDRAVYNLDSGKLVTANLHSSQDPILFGTEQLITTLEEGQTAMGMLETNDTFVTTHDSAQPNYRIFASKVIFHPAPENRIELHDIKLKVGDRTLFWFPYLSQSLDEELGLYLQPGYRSTWGAYLQTEYGWRWEDHTLVKYQLDLRSRRGLAGGVELHAERFKENENMRGAKLYYANDLNPRLSSTRRSRPDVNEDRYRFNLQHRIFLPGADDDTFYVDFDFNKISDEFMYQDFFPNEFRIDPSPDNTINLVKEWPGATLSLFGRFRLNDFYRTEERIPELALDITRQPLGNSGLFYEGETSLGMYRERLSALEQRYIKRGIGEFEDFFGVPLAVVNPGELRGLLDELSDQADGYSFKRFDTYHQLSYPTSLFGWLNLVPRVGFRHTSYFDIDSGDPNADSTEQRTLFHAGIEGAFKLSRVYPNISSEAWGLDGLRHIMEPYFNYSFLAGNELPNSVPRIDRLTPITQLRPIDQPKFTAIDDIKPWNILRLGVRNSLQTKRDGETYNWLRWNSYFDTFIEDPEFQRTYSNLFNEVAFSPVPWLSLEVDSQLPVFADDVKFTEMNSRIRIMPNQNMEFLVNHRYLNNHPFFGDSNLVNLRFYSRLSENWGFEIHHRFELDDNTLELQEYLIHRDLSSWTAALGAIARDNRGAREYGLVLALTMKDLPRVTLPLSFDPEPSDR